MQFSSPDEGRGSKYGVSGEKGLWKHNAFHHSPHIYFPYLF